MRNTKAEISSPGRRVLAALSAGPSLLDKKRRVDALPPNISVASSSLLPRKLSGWLLESACVELALDDCESAFADRRLEGNKRYKEASK